MTHANTDLCHCGEPLHYRYESTRRLVERFIAAIGQYVNVTVNGRTFRVQRHYIALHGINAADLPSLGFEEIEKGAGP
jgi:hypothetical protein